jgi:TPR repeat protein
VPLELGEAANWYLQAAENGHANAQYRVAVCYGAGCGVDKNLFKAGQWFLKAGWNHSTELANAFIGFCSAILLFTLHAWFPVGSYFLL